MARPRDFVAGVRLSPRTDNRGSPMSDEEFEAELFGPVTSQIFDATWLHDSQYWYLARAPSLRK